MNRDWFDILYEQHERITDSNCTDTNSIGNWIGYLQSVDTLPLSLLKHTTAAAAAAAGAGGDATSAFTVDCHLLNAAVCVCDGGKSVSSHLIQANAERIRIRFHSETNA